jgi:hypothetical protein
LWIYFLIELCLMIVNCSRCVARHFSRVFHLCNWLRVSLR